MVNRVFLITGATNAIGKHTALQLAKTGGTVLIHSRNPGKLAETKEEIKQAYKYADVVTYCADFSSMEGVRHLAAEVKKEFTHIDLLVNNVQVKEHERHVTVDGFEKTFAINVMVPMMLSSLLFNLIKRAEKPQIINIASRFQASYLDFEDLQMMDDDYDGEEQYRVTKTCLIMLSIELGDKCRPLEMRVNTLDPEVGRKEMQDNAIYELAMLDKYRRENMKYLEKRHPVNPMPICDNRDKREKLWDIVLGMTGATFDFIRPDDKIKGSTHI